MIERVKKIYQRWRICIDFIFKDQLIFECKNTILGSEIMRLEHACLRFIQEKKYLIETSGLIEEESYFTTIRSNCSPIDVPTQISIDGHKKEIFEIAKYRLKVAEINLHNEFHRFLNIDKF